MTAEPSGRVDEGKYLSPMVPIFSPAGSSLVEERNSIELSPKLRADLLDFDAWGEILTTFGRTMRVGVALTDAQGLLLGKCHNAQPVWSLIRAAAPGGDGGCPFCLTTRLPCTAVADALQAGRTVMVHDQVGLSHVAVPLLLGKQHLGAVVAGQVFVRYPEPLPLRRAATEFGVSAQDLWDVARKQRPVSGTSLQASGDLLCALGQAFLQQRYSTILESRLAETNAHFRWLVEGVRDYALFTLDLTGRVTSWNAGAERLLGYGKAEIMGQNFSCLFAPEDMRNRVPEEELNEVLRAGQAEVEGWRIRRDGKHFRANVNITTLLEDAGPVRGFALIMQDVTERRRVAIVLEETQQARARLQETFLSHVSHELRTPLTAIYFFTTNVMDGLFGELNPQQREQLALAVENIQQLKGMVSDLVDVTRVDTYKLNVEPQHADPVKLIAEALSTCRTNAVDKKVSLRSEVAEGLPFVWADPVRVRQILINLIDNGIKSTPEGGIITVGSRPLADDSFLCLTVSDTGCGIGPENLQIVFDRLAQLKSSAEASRSGLGLGLFISRDLVFRQGGQIWVESQLGQGSSFHFTLPVFSLAKLCAQVFAAPNLESGGMTLIAVDVAAAGGEVQAEILPEIRRALQRCVHPGHDVVLPSMGDELAAGTFFIVASTDSSGFEVIANRIRRELQHFDDAAKLKPAISSTKLQVSPGQSREEQVREITAQIERLVKTPVVSKEGLQ